jgi:hypothetical protein
MSGQRIMILIFVGLIVVNAQAMELTKKGGIGYDGFGWIQGLSFKYWLSERIGLQGILMLESISFEDSKTADQSEYAVAVNFNYLLAGFEKGNLFLNSGLGVISENDGKDKRTTEDIGALLKAEYFICPQISFDAGTGFHILVEPNDTRFIVGNGNFLGSAGFHYYF